MSNYIEHIPGDLVYIPSSVELYDNLLNFTLSKIPLVGIFIKYYRNYKMCDVMINGKVVCIKSYEVYPLKE